MEARPLPTGRQLRQRVRTFHEQCRCFEPPDYLPVRIYPQRPQNPYALTRRVHYANGVVSVDCDEGFQWDGASIPAPWVLGPWLATLALHYLATMGCIRSWFVWFVTAALLGVTLRVAPYLQKMGPHARAGCFHDQLYRRGDVSRPIADAIFLEIMRYDGVALEARWLIYWNVRLFGWKPFRHWAAVRAAEARGARSKEQGARSEQRGRYEPEKG